MASVEEVGARLRLRDRRRFVGDVESTERAVGDLERSFDQLGDATEEAGGQGKRAARELEGGFDDAAGGVEGKLGGVVDFLKGPGTAMLVGAAAGVGIAAGAAFVKGLGDAIENQALESKLAASLDLDPETTAKAQGVAEELFRDAYGENLTQVHEAVRAVHFELADLTDTGEEALKNLTVKGIDLAEAFDKDVNEVLRTAGQLVRTGLARDADKALDLLARGLSSPADRADDLLETFDEYATTFERLGLSGEDAIELISGALDAGVHNADRVADALREFQIRAIDGSETTAESFEIIGLDAEEMSEKIAAGGPKAERAMSEIVRALVDVEDPIEKNTAAVGLFGSMFEDEVSPKAIAALDPMAQHLDRVSGAADRVGDTLNDNTQVALESLKRSGLGALEDFAEGALPSIERVTHALESEGLAGAFDQVGEEWQRAWPEVQRWFEHEFVPWWETTGKPWMEWIGGSLAEWLLNAFADVIAKAGPKVVEGALKLVAGPFNTEASDWLIENTVGNVEVDLPNVDLVGPAPRIAPPEPPKVAGEEGRAGGIARALGGPMLPGRSYTVGERGPERVDMHAWGGMVSPLPRQQPIAIPTPRADDGPVDREAIRDRLRPYEFILEVDRREIARVSVDGIDDKRARRR